MNKEMETNRPAHPPTPGGAVALASTEKRTGWLHGYYRWVICALLFFATTINYIDRQIIGVLKPHLEGVFGWSQIDYGNIIFSFQLAYAIGYAVTGRFMDRVGVRLGFGLAVLLWSVAAMAHGLARSVAGFCAARFGLGFAEGGNFPASIKTVAEWFPKKERALATGIFNAGSNVGAVVTPLAAPWLAVTFGWPVAFYVTGALGFLWLVAWWMIYRHPHQHPRVSAEELAHIQRDPPDPAVKISWLQLLRHRQTWSITLGMLFTAPVWWFYLYWVPDFLNKQHGLNLMQLGPPLVVIYLLADVGSVAGGWISSHLIHRGWSVNAARKTAMLICALCEVPVCLAPLVSNVWVAVCLIGLAASAHQGFSANLFTTVSDTMPRFTVSSAVGIGGLAGSIGGMFVAQLVGHILEWTHNNYFVPFAIAASAYLTVLLIIHLLLPTLAPMKLPQTALQQTTQP